MEDAELQVAIGDVVEMQQLTNLYSRRPGCVGDTWAKRIARDLEILWSMIHAERFKPDDYTAIRARVPDPPSQAIWWQKAH